MSSKAMRWAAERMIREDHAETARQLYENHLKERPSYKIVVCDLFTLGDNGSCWLEEIPRRLSLYPDDMLELARWILETFDKETDT